MRNFSRAQLLRVHPEPVADDAATRAVLWRYERGELSKEDTLTVLQVLGLVEDGQSTKRGPDGRRLGPVKAS